jgi:hypothetical protein
MIVFTKAVEFFHYILYDYRAWSKDLDFEYKRGAWVCCYRVSLHAWNVNFFFMELALLKREIITS